MMRNERKKNADWARKSVCKLTKTVHCIYNLWTVFTILAAFSPLLLSIVVVL